MWEDCCRMVWWVTLGLSLLIVVDAAKSRIYIGVDTSAWLNVKEVAAEVQKRE